MKNFNSQSKHKLKSNYSLDEVLNLQRIMRNVKTKFFNENTLNYLSLRLKRCNEEDKIVNVFNEYNQYISGIETFKSNVDKQLMNFESGKNKFEQIHRDLREKGKTQIRINMSEFNPISKSRKRNGSKNLSSNFNSTSNLTEKQLDELRSFVNINTSLIEEGEECNEEEYVDILHLQQDDDEEEDQGKRRINTINTINSVNLCKRRNTNFTNYTSNTYACETNSNTSASYKNSHKNSNMNSQASPQKIIPSGFSNINTSSNSPQKEENCLGMQIKCFDMKKKLKEIKSSNRHFTELLKKSNLKIKLDKEKSSTGVYLPAVEKRRSVILPSMQESYFKQKLKVNV